MKWLARVAIALALVVALGVGVLHLFGEGIWDAVAQRPPVMPLAALGGNSAPNEFVVCPAGMCGGRPDLVSPIYEMTPDALRDVVQRRLLDQGLTAFAPGGRTLIYTTHSPVLRFPDDTVIRIVPVDEGSALAIRAKARIGVEDFGVNEARVRKWLGLLVDLERKRAT